jgi:hypothetical protein
MALLGNKMALLGNKMALLGRYTWGNTPSLSLRYLLHRFPIVLPSKLSPSEIPATIRLLSPLPLGASCHSHVRLCSLSGFLCLLTQHTRAPSTHPLSALVARPAAPRRRLAFGLQPHLAVVPAAGHRISLTWRLSTCLQYLPFCPASRLRARRASSPAGRALRHAALSWHPDRTPSRSSALDQGHRIPVPAAARLRGARSSAPYSGRRPAGAVSGHGSPQRRTCLPRTLTAAHRTEPVAGRRVGTAASRHRVHYCRIAYSLQVISDEQKRACHW